MTICKKSYTSITMLFQHENDIRRNTCFNRITLKKEFSRKIIMQIILVITCLRTKTLLWTTILIFNATKQVERDALVQTSVHLISSIMMANIFFAKKTCSYSVDKN